MGKFVLSESSEGFRFMLENAKGEILGLSPFFLSKNECMKAIAEVLRCAPTASLEDRTKDNCQKASDPKFVVYPDSNDMYRFSLEGENGRSLMVSPSYTSLAHCLSSIALTRYNAKGAKRS
jgi:uncharacterized protein YegP (UPF0339 family)